MGGLFLDDLVVYLFKAAVHRCWDRVSRTWPVANGMVAIVLCPEDRTSSTTEVLYTYTVEDKTYKGVHAKPFLLSSSANEYASRFPKGTKLVVRVLKDDPGVSFVRDEEQFWAKSK